MMSGVECNPGPTNRFNMGLINAWSIVNKTALIHDAIADHSLDLLAVTETFVYEDSPDVYKQDAAPDGYSIIHQHRQQRPGTVSPRGGGIALIHRENIKIKAQKIDPAKHKSFELLMVKLPQFTHGMNIVIIYRPPKGSISDFITEMRDLLDSGEFGDRYVICGDLNCPGPVNTRGLVNDELVNLIEEHSLTQHVQSATCRTGNILDHILTPSTLATVTNINVNDIGLSDHSLVTCKFAEEFNRTPIATASFRSWKRLDVKSFKEQIISSSIFQKPANTANSFADQLETDICKILDKLLPVHKITKRTGKSSNHWLSEEAVVAKQRRRQLERRWKRTNYEAVRIAYRTACKAANRLINESRRVFYAQRVTESSHDPKKLWQTVKGILHINRSNTCSEPGMCNKFALYFTSKIDKVKTAVAECVKLVKTVPATNQKPPASSLDLLSPATESEVAKVILRLPNKTSPLDFIHTSVLKSCSDVFVPLITRLINLSFQEGCFPDKFKRAQVTPLLKKPGLDEKDPSNYRPISNLNTIGKIIERVCLARLLPHVACTGNFSPMQSAYRKMHSTETALLKILDDLYRIIDSKNAAVLIGLDLSAAFDTVDHRILIERLKTTFGITGTALTFLQSYLNLRTQYVKVGGEQSPIAEVTVGVPQGSVLGPFLFSAYVSPIADVISSYGVQFHQYADDTQLYTAVKSGTDLQSIERLETCSCAVRDWFALNGMLLNPDKSEVLLVARKVVANKFANGSGVAVAGSDITFSVKLKSLGVTIDQTLSFDQYVRDIVKTSNFHIKALRHVRPLLNKTVANTIACSIVSTRLDYCNSLLYGTSVTNIAKLQRVQNSLARVVAGAKRSDHITPVLRDLHWLPVTQRITYKIALLTHKVRQQSQPQYLTELVRPYRPSRQLRSSGQHLISRPSGINSKLGEQSFSHAAHKTWSDLPEDLRATSDIRIFKAKLKTFLFSNFLSNKYL